MGRRAKITLIWTGSAILLSGILIGVCGWYLYSTAEHTAAKMYEAPADRPAYVSKDPLVQVNHIRQPAAESGTNDNGTNDKNGQAFPIRDKKPFTVLMLGVDQRKNDRGRSDAIILLTVNPMKKSILMFNIPRDSRTEIIGRGTVDKINHAYAFGGVSMSIATVEQFLDYPVDYYIKVNMEGFESIIDQLGGVDVVNPFAFDYQGRHFDKGELHLNGSEALLFSRMRYDDPRGDFGRNARQRSIVKQLMKKTASFSGIMSINSLLGSLGDSVRTNITFAEMKTFIADYWPEIDKIDVVEIKGQGKTIGGVWYYLVDEAERQRIHDLMRSHLQ